MYTDISHYYDQIFPITQTYLDSVYHMLMTDNVQADLCNHALLEIGCGTGSVTIGLAQRGLIPAMGLDLDSAMVQLAITKSSLPINTSLPVSFIQGNMLKLKDLIGEKTFMHGICLGNTLVHLSDTAEVLHVLKQMHSVMQKGASCIFQILHYDWILSEKISILPLIDTPAVQFKRTYLFDKAPASLKFITELLDKSTGKTITQDTQLLPLKRMECTALLKEAGFLVRGEYGDMQKSPLMVDSLPLVIACEVVK